MNKLEPRHSLLKCLAVMLGAFGGLGFIAQAAADDWLVLTDLMLVDGTGDPARAVSKLVARNGVIVSLGEEGALPEPFDVVTQIDLGGAFVIPGLIDGHVHLSGFPGDRNNLEARMQAGLRGGVTSVRDMAGDLRTLADGRRAMQRGEFLGLTVATSALFGGDGLFADPRVVLASPGHKPGSAPWAQAATPDTDLRQAVAAARGAGADAIKIYGNLDAPMVFRLATEARRQQLKVWAHATVFPARPGDLLDAGVQVLSHAPYLVWEAVDKVPDDYGARRNGPYASVAVDHPALQQLLRRMAEQGAMLDTTLMIYRDVITGAEGPHGGAWAQAAFDWGVAVTREAYRAGVPIVAGTDRFLKDEWSLPDLHAELEVLVNEVGMRPAEALRTATAHAARAAGLEDSRGTLEIGKAADLIVLDENPLKDITATRTIRWVFKDGVIAHRQRDRGP